MVTAMEPHYSRDPLVLICRGGSYALLTLAGLFYAIEPAPTIIEALGHGGAVVWALFLAFGGLLAALSVWHPVWQALGLPLIVAALGTLGVSLLLTPLPGQPWWLPRPAGVFDLALALLYTLQGVHARRALGWDRKRPRSDDFK